MIRAFCALAMPQALRVPLEAVQADLPAGRPVEAEALHLTLAFYGEQPWPMIEEIHHLLEEIDAPAVTVEIDGLGMFGDPPRSLHARVRDTAGLDRLAAKTRRVAEIAGAPLKRARFRPHVTLARFDGRPGPEERARLERVIAARAGMRAGPVEIDEFTLFRSRLGKSGASYEALARYPLR